jgi:hypothetical protein
VKPTKRNLNLRIPYRSLLIFLSQRSPELFIDSISYLCDVISSLKTRRSIKSLVLAYVAVDRVFVSKTAQKAFVADGFFAVTVTINAVQQFPILFGKVVRFGNFSDK